MEGSNVFIYCRQARDYDLVSYLACLGIEPARIRGNQYWYFSPFRSERTPSFKIDRLKNLYYDFGEGKGGDIITFATRFHDCTISEFLASLTGGFSFHQHPFFQQAKAAIQLEEPAIKINMVSILKSAKLWDYIQRRRIPVSIAGQYCKEVHFELYGKRYYAIGFPNDSGGFELRNLYYKGSNSPKDITSFIAGKNMICVFEGFFDFLSLLTLSQNWEEAPESDYLILNSLSLFERARPVMESYGKIRLFLDNNSAGRNYTTYAQSLSSDYKDESGLYKNHNDLNDYLCCNPT